MTDVSSGGEAQNARLANLRAATMLRETAHVSLDAATESALSAIAAEMNMSRPELIRMALVDWLESHKNSRAAAND
ncbi:ribbon-helix-helix protein, CopG family [Mesorhizobium sp. M7A.F.Ca.US.003.02.2.1]|nr:ribbon-helix-helix protein, CopG family [Mesorhizobium sp. M7A.F.Ca.US.007.01.2.1]RUZ48981.1 ribbon-helix-helix protein, CopG family [Mesorhizobium sp. M7A.F.Ca.US.003.02.1.1]RUZ69726.1 ribbon-helix-helix protein, CopG family [Mesorhizobium sp. M7A.F.Ca.US.007.01.1.1]RUZ87554.1 ribbon-helix-helix protein, CopG family [Mesorhizobium sp. M7A.F.Ca.US.003.02.2.1]RVA12678.1 ribbon-helix-helix protein, CopG family [Mesorhizobium sp. M7A.F.Ca.US.002.01.1.1]